MKKLVVLLMIILVNFSLFANGIETYIIIIGGGKSPKDAQMAKQNYLQHSELVKQIKTDVNIVCSNEVKGLNPGFYIAIMGYCTDEFKARLLTNFANKYIKGVYFKKVTLDKDFKSPEFFPVLRPFSGKEYVLLIKGFKYFYNDKEGKNRISGAYGNVLVNDKIIYTEKKGLVDIEYYIGWVYDTKQVIYLNQFQFSKLFSNNSGWIEECEIEEKMVKYGPEFEAPERKEECKYPNGVNSLRDSGYEWDTSTYSFPISKFTFEEVLNYYAGQGYMGFLFRSDLKPKGEHKFINKAECEIIYIPGKEASLDCYHEWSGVTKEKDVIEYTGGGGA